MVASPEGLVFGLLARGEIGTVGSCIGAIALLLLIQTYICLTPPS